MSKIWVSDKSYTGALKLDNLIDSLSSAKEKYDYVYSSLLSQNVDVSTLTEAQAVSVIDSFKTHKNRVISDGGYLLNTNKTLRAIHFAINKKLTGVAYSALSLAFGYKLNESKQLVKLYSISGALYDGIVDTPTRLQINSEYIQSSLAQIGTITVQTAFNAANPIFVVNTKFNSTTTAGQVSVRTQNTAATSGITLYEDLTISSSGASTATFRASDDTSIARSLAAGRLFNNKGVSLLFSDMIKTFSSAYGGDVEYSYSKARKDMSSVAQYFSLRVGSTSDTTGLNSFLSEAWFIGGNTSTDLARDLAKSLDIG